jgi:hypothetical protein
MLVTLKAGNPSFGMNSLSDNWRDFTPLRNSMTTRTRNVSTRLRVNARVDVL